MNSSFNPIVISGSNITVTGSLGHVIDGNGQAYWDGKGSNGGGSKPNHFISVKSVRNATIHNLNIQNWPTHCFSITGASGLMISDLVLNNSAGDIPNSKSGRAPAAHNTDGFDISSSSRVILRNTQVVNQDDCVAVTSGTNITITSMICSGGHGLSIGSVGGKSDNTVDGVTFSDSQILNSENGCRIKTNWGESGTVNNITYSNITLSNITKYGIDIQQDYLNGGPTGTPTNGVGISNISFSDITGTTIGSAYNYYILCGNTSCSSITFSGVNITGGSKGYSCNFPASGCP
jgi:polygalacturonase